MVYRELSNFTRKNEWVKKDFDGMRDIRKMIGTQKSKHRNSNENPGMLLMGVEGLSV